MVKKKVLIVGGGFGGIKVALDLSQYAEHFDITLLSDREEFHYHPSLYHTATGGSRQVSSIPLTEIVGSKPIKIAFGHANKLNREHKTIQTSEGDKYSYDILILALGSVTNYFGIRGMQEYSFGIKSIKEAEELKAHIHKQLIEDKKPDINYIIIGGGPTGVELAGALPSYVKRIMKQHGLRESKLHIDLVEAAPHIMPHMPKSVSKAFEKRLRKLGVKLYLGTPVQAETANTILMNGKYVRSHTVIWTAGTINNDFYEKNSFMITKNHKVQVDKLLQAWPGVFVVGDNADTPYSGMAQTALYDGHYVAENLVRHANCERPYSYKPKKPIFVTPAGPYWASVVWGSMHIYGWLGWIIRQASYWVGYRDLEPWWRATELLMANTDKEDDCPVCATSAQSTT